MFRSCCSNRPTKHYQKMDYSWQPKTVRNYRITDRNEIPDGQLSGMCRQDFIVRKDHLSWRLADRKVFLTGAPDGLWEGGSGWIPDGYPSGIVVLAVRKSTMSSKKNYTCGTTYIKFSLYASSIYMSIIYIYQTCHPASYWIRMNKWLQDI